MITNLLQSLSLIAYRGHHIENIHAVQVAIASPDISTTLLSYFNPAPEKGIGAIEEKKPPEFSTFFRSAAKPFQAIPLVLSPWATELTPEELAVICASHTANFEHLTHINSILQKAGMAYDALGCGAHAPLDPDTQLILAENNLKPDKIHNNCSGKHAGMLFYCIKQGYPTEGYLEPSHPLQQDIIQHLKSLTDFLLINTAVDGCGTPTYHLPLSTMATLYQKLINNPIYLPIIEAMTEHPTLAGGQNRIDTLIMQASNGNLLAKVGADGLICIGNRKEGTGLALKVLDGSTDIRNIAIIQLLQALRWLAPEESGTETFLTHFTTERTNTLGTVIGHYQLQHPLTS